MNPMYMVVKVDGRIDSSSATPNHISDPTWVSAPVPMSIFGIFLATAPLLESLRPATCAAASRSPAPLTRLFATEKGE